MLDFNPWQMRKTFFTSAEECIGITKRRAEVRSGDNSDNNVFRRRESQLSHLKLL
jgi:hypothetical protein